MDALRRLNELTAEEALAELLRCCGSTRWASAMTARRPYADAEVLQAAAEDAWWALGDGDWLQAFAHHPKIGDRQALRARFASTAAWAADEQKGAAVAGDDVLQALEDGNRAYEARFGYIFIVCATGKTAPEMLALLQERLTNAPRDEIRKAAREQAKITRLRLERLLAS
ncbi:MAG TPA: 2-oxo-4-hydroxy-4-carboxy-5-ureidoimidazoline decarboxylase [Vicinamibacteria bacterium]